MLSVLLAKLLTLLSTTAARGPFQDNHGGVLVLWRGRVRRITPQRIDIPTLDDGTVHYIEQPLEVPPLYTNEDRFPPEYPHPKAPGSSTEADAESLSSESPTPSYSSAGANSVVPRGNVDATGDRVMDDTVSARNAIGQHLSAVDARTIHSVYRRRLSGASTGSTSIGSIDNQRGLARPPVFPDAVPLIPPPQRPAAVSRVSTGRVASPSHSTRPVRTDQPACDRTTPPLALQSNWVRLGDGCMRHSRNRTQHTSMPPPPPTMLPPVRGVTVSPRGVTS